MTGQVSFANVANQVAVANVTGIGNIATVNLDGNTSNILSGSGTWVSAGAVGGQPGGSNTQIQYNNSGSFAGNSAFTYDFASQALAVPVANVNLEYILETGNPSNWMWLTYNSPVGAFQIASWSSNIELSVNGQQQVIVSGPNVSIHGSLNLSPSNGNSNVVINSANIINLTSNSHVWSFGNTGDLSVPNGNISNANIITANYFSGNGNNISNITGANIIGADGNTSNVLYGNGVFAAAPVSSTVVFTKAATWQSSSGAITTPIIDIPVYIPINCTITGVSILTQGGTGSCVTDIWKTPVGSYPPTNANSICGGNYPTISSGVTLVDTTLTSWTKSVSAGDTIMFHLTSSSVFTYITIQLTLQQN